MLSNGRYKKAWSSMKACPTRLQHASEAEKLNGIGPKLCKRLEEKHKEYCQLHDLPLPQRVCRDNAKVPRVLGDLDASIPEEVTEEPPKKKRKAKEYVPALRTGPYALIMALSTLDEEGRKALSKQDLIKLAQPMCDSSFTVASDTTKMYTAWKSMQDLEKRELVCTRGHPSKRYYLSDEGWDLAKRMKAQEEGLVSKATAATTKNKRKADLRAQSPGLAAGSFPSASEIVELESTPEPEACTTPARKLISIRDSGPSARRGTWAEPVRYEPIVLQPGTFEVQLLLDTREIRSTTDRDYISSELRKQGVIADLRALPLGDVLWIAKLKPPHDSLFRHRNAGDDEEGSTEVILNHVLERKRLDDLVYSIKDGRFHEQKFRLKKSGIQHVTYLIEDFSISSEKMELYGESIESAIASMQVVNDIFVKKTTKLDESIKYLARMTMSLQEMYAKKKLHVLPSASLDASTHHHVMDKLRDESPSTAYCITFSAFAALCDKSDSLTLRDIYLKMLMCVKGVSGEKAIEIQKIWPTPSALIEAYSNARDKIARDTLISNHLGTGIPRKQISKALSTQIAQVWAG